MARGEGEMGGEKKVLPPTRACVLCAILVALRAIACDCMRLHATTCDNMRQHARGRSPASEQLGASQMVQRGYTGF